MSLPSIADESPWLIALDADFSGGAKNGGIAIQRGAELAIDRINQAGGLLGKPVELITTNHRGNPARGVVHIKQHVSNPNVIALLGGVHTPVVLAQLKELNDGQLPFLIPWAAGTSIADNQLVPNPVFRVSLRDEQAAITMLDHAKEQGFTRVSLILERTGWGRSNEISLNKQAKIRGIEVDETLWFNWRQTSYDVLLDAIKPAENKSIVLVGNAPESAQIIKGIQLHPWLKNKPIISHWGITAGSFVDSVGLDALTHVDLRVLQSFHLSRSNKKNEVSSLISAYNLRYLANVDEFTMPAAPGVAQAYELVSMLAQVVENQKSTQANKLIAGLGNLLSFNGVIKNYTLPFSEANRDALLAPDYLMASYNTEGHLAPIDD